MKKKNQDIFLPQDKAQMSLFLTNYGILSKGNRTSLSSKHISYIIQIQCHECMSNLKDKIDFKNHSLDKG